MVGLPAVWAFIYVIEKFLGGGDDGRKKELRSGSSGSWSDQ